MTEPALLKLSPALKRALEAQARHAWPEECCGLLVGQVHLSATDGKHVEVISLVESANQAPLKERPHCFEIDPALHLSLQRKLRATSQSIVGVYHSHPNGRAELSEADRLNALESDFVWLVLALSGDKKNPMQWGAYWREGSGRGACFKAMRLDIAAEG